MICPTLTVIGLVTLVFFHPMPRGQHNHEYRRSINFLMVWATLLIINVAEIIIDATSFH